MVYRKIIVVLMLVVCIVSSEQISISGRIFSTDGSAIVGAGIQLKNYSQFNTESDAVGVFHLKGDTITPITHFFHSNTKSVQLGFIGKHLIVKMREGKCAISLNIVDSRGRSMFNTYLTGASSGEQTIPVVMPDLAKGIYYVIVREAGVRLVYKMILTGGACFSKAAIQQNTVTYAATGKTPGAQTVIDTIVVTAAGYKHRVVDIVTYDQQDVRCTLFVSNPWTPSAALEYEGSMVKILAKGYDFEMGQPDPNIWEPDSIEDTDAKREQPIHTVSFTYDFWMDTALVTQKEYDAAMSSAYSEYKTPGWGTEYGFGDRYPSYLMMWGDAALYCNALSKSIGFDTVYAYDSISGTPGKLCKLDGVTDDIKKNGYRLPTEAEWEYACRGGTGTDYFWGENYKPYPAVEADTAEIGSYTVWKVNAWDPGIGNAGFGTHPVAQKKPNPYGLYDMSGNLYEWCNDWWGGYYSWEDVVDPIGPDSGPGHIARGGSWGNDATFLRSANRRFFPPDYLYNFLGFRTVRAVQ